MISLLNSYNEFMNRTQPIHDGELVFDFEFLTNEMEAHYEGVDFFNYHWPYNQKVLNGINKALNQNAFVYQPHEPSSFVVASMGSSSTQTYMVDGAGQIKTQFYELGTGNFKKDVFGQLTSDLLESKRDVVFMNSIGFGVRGDAPFLILPSNELSDDRKAAQAIEALSDLVPKGLIWIVMNSRVKPKLKNDWTNAFILEKRIDPREDLFFVDYGGGSISVQHARGNIMDENAIAKFKYDQDPIVDFYKDKAHSLESKERIAPQLVKNRNDIIHGIDEYIQQNHLYEHQHRFNVIIRQTGKLRELYRQISSQYLVNPETNRLIKTGGLTHRKLMRKYGY